VVELVDVLDLYDHDERFVATHPDLRREELPHLVRHVDLAGRTGVVLFSRLSSETADQAIEEQVAYFASLEQDFEWKAYAHDQPPDLVERLASHGFEIDEIEAIMVLDPARSSPVLAPDRPDIAIQRVQRPDKLRDVGSIRQRVYGDDTANRLNGLANEMEQSPNSISIYVAYLNAEPAACGWIRFPTNRAFASLWGGSTVPELRSRGLYRAVLDARIQEARARGTRYLTVDARSMSRPILERAGFQTLTHATACTWSAHGA
jgi:GNAT superfamily N-acetyltransferase